MAKKVSWERGFDVELPRAVMNRAARTRRKGVWITVNKEEALLREARYRFEDSPFCLSTAPIQRDLEVEALLADVVVHPQPRIPRIVHHIWFGDLSRLSPEAKRCIESWKRFHPAEEWTFMFWTDESIAKAFSDWGVPREALEMCANPAEKSDVARYGILHRLGGIYCDVDLECIAALDAALLTYDIVVSFANVDACCEIGNSFLASSASHSLMKLVFDECCSHAAQISRTASISKAEIIGRTGPGALTRVWSSNVMLERNWLILPSSFVYPVANDRERSECESETYHPETFAVHWWHKSW